MGTWGARQRAWQWAPRLLTHSGLEPPLYQRACAFRSLLRAPLFFPLFGLQPKCLSGTALPSPPGSLPACPMLPSAPLIKMLPVVF